jgi:hypothetical protein
VLVLIFPTLPFRGGDIPKWLDCQIEYVLGIDISGNEISNAKERAEYVWGLQIAESITTRPAFQPCPN